MYRYLTSSEQSHALLIFTKVSFWSKMDTTVCQYQCSSETLVSINVSVNSIQHFNPKDLSVLGWTVSEYTRSDLNHGDVTVC